MQRTRSIFRLCSRITREKRLIVLRTLGNTTPCCRTTSRDSPVFKRPSTPVLMSDRIRAASPCLETMRLESPHFKDLFTPELNKLTALFEKYGHEIRIAGGAVRDLLLDRMPNDVDFATTATPVEMKEMFEKEEIRMINTKGEKHGTITCRINDKENFEVTTLRIDVVTDGRHAEVEFTRDWQLDALRRDLTINSMFLGFDGTVYDYFSGRQDLKQCKVRFVGSATDRVQEDYLRILRYFRFYGRVAKDSDAHEQETLRAIQENINGLKGISGERLWVELKKIVIGNHADDLVRVMMQLGLAPCVGLPDAADAVEFARVWERCRHLGPAPMTMMAALMQHEEQVMMLNERLKMSKDELRTGAFIVLHRGDDLLPDALSYCQDLLCDTIGKEPKTKDKIRELLKYLGRDETLRDFETWNLPRFPVNGIKLLEMGVPKGPSLAKVLAGLREKWKESRYAASEDELLKFVDEVREKIS